MHNLFAQYYLEGYIYFAYKFNPMRPRTIAIFNQKGGTAKTSTTVNLGAALARLVKKVLLVDLDQQGSLSYYLAIKPDVTVAEVLMGKASLQQAVYEREGLHVLAANMRLIDWEWSVAQDSQRFFILRHALFSLDYDYILLDCPPSVGLSSLNALVAARGLIAPMPLDVMALHGLDQLMGTVKKVQKDHNPRLTLLGVLFTMVDSSKEITREVFDLFHTRVRLPVFQSVINSDTAALEAPSFGQSVLSYAPSAISSIEYQYLAKEILSMQDTVWLD